MFKIVDIKITQDLIKKCNYEEFIPIANIYSEKSNKPIKTILLKRNFESKNNIDNIDDKYFIKEELKKDKLKCPFCDRCFSNKYNTERHIDKYCIFKKVKLHNIKKENKKSDLQYDIKLNEDEKINSQFPNPILRDISYVSAPYGAGKSTYVKNYLKSFMELFDIIKTDEIMSEESIESSDEFDEDIFEEIDDDLIEELLNEIDVPEVKKENKKENKKDCKQKKKVFLFSRIDNDESFRDYIEDGTITQLDINEDEIIDNPYNAKEELNNSLIIFDDYELLNKNIQKSIEITLKDVLLNGRDQAKEGNDIYAVVTSHQISNYSRTRDILNEASSITFFCKAGSTRGISYVLKNYCGIGNKQIEDIINLPSRWVTVYKRYPMWVLYEKGCYALN